MDGCVDDLRRVTVPADERDLIRAAVHAAGVGYSAVPAALWTPRAMEQYQRCQAGLKHRIVGVTRTTVRRYAAALDWYDGKKSVQGLPETVRELRATHADRVLVQEHQGRLVIVNIGDHDSVDRYVRTTPGYRLRQLDAATQTPAAFHPGTAAPLFTDIDDVVEPEFAEELDSGWLTFLSEEQSQVAEQLFGHLSRARAHGPQATPFVAYVRGGAGTGKTAILLNLALRLRDSRIPVRLECSTALARHLTQHTKINVGRLQEPLTERGVLLVDDPGAPDVIADAVARATKAQASAVLVAFDPLQWRSKFLNGALQALPDAGFDHRLGTCYRQSHSLAEQAIEIVAAVHDRSSWRVDPPRVQQERQVLKQLEAEYLTGLTFAKPGGRAKVIPRSALHDELAVETDLLRARWDRWPDMPTLLVLEDRDHGVRLTKDKTHLMTGLSRVTHGLQDVPSYRGLDFQSVWIFMNHTFFDRVQQGKLGLSTKEWESLRDLHVAFTRAKDETVLFLV